MSSIGIAISIIAALFAEAIIPRNFSTEVIHSILPFPAGGLLGVISELLVLRHNTNGLKRRYWRIQLRVDSNLLARISGVVLTRTRLRYSHWLLIESSASSYHRGRIRIAILLVKIHFYLFLNTMNFMKKPRFTEMTEKNNMMNRDVLCAVLFWVAIGDGCTSQAIRDWYCWTLGWH